MEDLPEKDPFHSVGNLFPHEIDPLTIAPEVPVREALRLMVEHHYSQLPVVEDGQVRGIFSFWSLSQALLSTPDVPVHELPVEDVMETIPSVTVLDSLHGVLSSLEQHEALLVSAPGRVQAVVTPFDVLKYFYGLARPFVLLGEIELALRSLIQVRATGEVLSRCIERSIAKMYEGRHQPVPVSLDQMSFEDYRSIITSKDNWPLFEGTLGKNRELVRSKLESIRNIRNSVFHFRRDISVIEHENLAATRDWLLDKARKVRAHDERGQA